MFHVLLRSLLQLKNKKRTGTSPKIAEEGIDTKHKKKINRKLALTNNNFLYT